MSNEKLVTQHIKFARISFTRKEIIYNYQGYLVKLAAGELLCYALTPCPVHRAIACSTSPYYYDLLEFLSFLFRLAERKLILIVFGKRNLFERAIADYLWIRLCSSFSPIVIK